MKPKKYEEIIASERISESDKVAVANINNDLTKDIKKIKKSLSLKELIEVIDPLKKFKLHWCHTLKQIVLE